VLGMTITGHLRIVMQSVIQPNDFRTLNDRSKPRGSEFVD